MSLNETPSGERIHIGFFGKRNAGKSSLVNAICGQALSIVSPTMGTTTDPVRKAMELLPLGPVVIIDTPGFDDTGDLGAQRVDKAEHIFKECDIAVLVADATQGLQEEDQAFLSRAKDRGLPTLTVFNKSDIGPGSSVENALAVSAKTGENIERLKHMLASMLPDRTEKKLVSDLIPKESVCILVCPIDSAAPKGRLILPQQQTIRDLIDSDNIPLVVKETELPHALHALKAPPALVITDSQVFKVVNEIVPPTFPLTSFSILMARYKGFLHSAVQGVLACDHLKDGDRILMAEGCTHHRQCGDIGTVKIPKWLRSYTGKDLIFETCSGREFPEDLKRYALVVHCGGCMLTETVVRERMHQAEGQVPFTNYGILIARMNGILERSLSIFPDLLQKDTEAATCIP